MTVSCVVDGGNPKPSLSWELTLGSLALLDAPEVPYQALNLTETVRDQKVGARSDARLERVMRAHHNATLTCVVHHIALTQPLNVSLLLDVQCKLFFKNVFILTSYMCLVYSFQLQKINIYHRYIVLSNYFE